MAPEYLSTTGEANPSFTRTRPAVALLLAILVAMSPGLWQASARAQGEDEASLTLSSFECSTELRMDGSPLAAAGCSGEADRSFVLSGPDNLTADLQTSLVPNAGGVEYRQAVWTADADDDSAISGTWSLREFDPDPNSADVVSCLKIIGVKFLPASLDYREDRRVQFDWNPAERLGSNVVAGEYLECSWYSLPHPAGEERPGLLMIRNAVASDPSDADLVVVEPEDEPQGFADAETAEDVRVTFTLTNEESGEQFEVQSDDSTGILTTTFALSPGEFAIESRSTGQSSSFSIAEGETVLILNTLARRPAVSITPTPIVVDFEETEATAPPTVEVEPTEVVEQEFEFSATDWTGAYPDVVTAVYGRDCVALYGVNSQFPSATLRFTADDAANGQSRLVLTGLDDEWAAQAPIEVSVNGEVVYQGVNGFNNWNPASPQVAWSQFAVTFSSDLIVSGQNEIVVTNLAEAANFGTPPYILLAEASVTIESEGDG